jgi:hypothetical protein
MDDPPPPSTTDTNLQGLVTFWFAVAGTLIISCIFVYDVCYPRPRQF